MPTHSLLDWPHQVPVAALNCLADAHFVHGLELGPPEWWQAWQHQRLGAMLQWLAPSASWQGWLASAAGSAAGLGVAPASATAALAGLPIMRRADYRALNASHAATAPPDHGPLHQHHSSGSVGVPVGFWRSELASRISINHYWADHQRQGRDLHASMAILTGAPDPHSGTHHSVPGDAWLQQGTQLARNALQFTLLEHAQWLGKVAPQYLVTTPARLSSLLSLIKIKRLPAPRIQQVLTSSHAVEPALRERTRRVLGASIRDRYSCEELGPIAFQCPQSDDYYHVAVGNVVVEIVDDAGRPVPEGTPGNVLVTGLHQWASPAARYDLGDIATGHSHCPGCGATVPALSHLLGRKYFLLYKGTGDLRHVRILAEHWLACAPVREHRVVQTGATAFRAELVLDHPLTPAESANILAMLQRLIGAECSFELAQLGAIPWPASAKRQEFVGLLP
jgi:phenylacetate-CoA ligase